MCTKESMLAVHQMRPKTMSKGKSHGPGKGAVFKGFCTCTPPVYTYFTKQ